MTDLYQLLANSIAVLHLAVALYLVSLPFVLLAGKAADWYLKLQVVILGIAGIFHFTSGICPLTFGENYFRVLSGGNKYEGNFLNHYTENFFHFSMPNKLISNTIILLAAMLVIVLVKKIRSKQRVEKVETI